jgi:hypothetical protein
MQELRRFRASWDVGCLKPRHLPSQQLRRGRREEEGGGAGKRGAAAASIYKHSPRPENSSLATCVGESGSRGKGRSGEASSHGRGHADEGAAARSWWRVRDP